MAFWLDRHTAKPRPNSTRIPLGRFGLEAGGLLPELAQATHLQEQLLLREAQAALASALRRHDEEDVDIVLVCACQGEHRCQGPVVLEILRTLAAVGVQLRPPSATSGSTTCARWALLTDDREALGAVLTQPDWLAGARRIVAKVLGGLAQRDPHLLEDILQEAQLRLLQRLDKWSPEESFTTWALGYYHVTALELRRKRKRVVSPHDLNERPDSRAGSPSSRARKSEELELLRGYLERARAVFPPYILEAWRLRDFDGLPVAEVAERCQRSQATIHRYCRSIREFLKAQRPEGDDER